MLTGCEDELDFGFGDWSANEDTVTLYTLDRVDYQGLPSGYAMGPPAQVVRIEERGATGTWDFALTGGTDGEPLMLTPVGALLDLDSQAGIVPLDLPYDEIESAPRDSAVYVTGAGVPVQAGDAFVVRSRIVASGRGACIRFGKVEPVELDAQAGTLTLVALVNPNCNDRNLVPTEDD